MTRVLPASLVLACIWTTAAGTQAPADAPLIVDRVGEYVERYYSRARSIVAREHVVLQPLRRDLTSDGFARRLEYELRLEWDPDVTGGESPATVVRELIDAAGPPLGPPDQPDCLDPKAISPEPLAFLLPGQHHKFTWRSRGFTRVNDRDAVAIDYRPVAPEPPKVVWDDQCGSIDLPGRLQGRIWVDPQTAGILRFDERLVGPVDLPAPREGRSRPGAPLYFTVQRADTSIRYAPVTFTNPDETILLPSEVQTVSVITNSGVPRLRVTQTFSDYRRFVTGSRLVR